MMADVLGPKFFFISQKEDNWSLTFNREFVISAVYQVLTESQEALLVLPESTGKLTEVNGDFNLQMGRVTLEETAMLLQLRALGLITLDPIPYHPMGGDVSTHTGYEIYRIQPGRNRVLQGTNI